MSKRESQFQAKLITELREKFPNCVILKNDSGYVQGVPDLTIFHGDRWACLECKKSLKEPHQPNQKWWLKYLNDMSYASMICPENKEAVLDELQQSFSSSRSTCIS